VQAPAVFAGSWVGLHFCAYQDALQSFKKSFLDPQHVKKLQDLRMA
jgi:hypothetical protein